MPTYVVMIMCLKTGKSVNTQIFGDSPRILDTGLGWTIKCPHCSEKHVMKKENTYVVEEKKRLS